MKKDRSDNLKYFNIFYVTLSNNFLFALKKISLNIVGSIYLLTNMIFIFLCLAIHSKSVERDSRVFLMMLNIFVIFILFIFAMLISVYFFIEHKKIGLLKIEQREGVPLWISYFVRVLNSYLFMLMYEIVLIIIINLSFINNKFNDQFAGSGLFNLINLQPLVMLFILFVTISLAIFFRIIWSVFASTMLGIVYSISALISVSSVSLMPAFSENYSSFSPLISNINLGKSFYDFAQENELDIYQSDYLDKIGKYQFPNHEHFNDIKFLYSNNQNEINNLCYYGEYNRLKSNSNNNDLIQDIKLFNNVFDKIWKASNGILFNSNYTNVSNSIFKGNLNEKIYDDFLDQLLSQDIIKNDEKIINIIKFAKENINKIFTVYLCSVDENDKDGTYMESSIPIGYFGSNNEPEKNENFMLDTLIWEIQTYYNLSISPVLTRSYKIENYVKFKEFANSSYGFIDSFLITNHIYTMLNYTNYDNVIDELSFNSFNWDSIVSKSIIKPFSVKFENDEKLSALLPLQTENSQEEAVTDTKEPYSKYISLKITRNVNVKVMYAVYILLSISGLSLMYLLYKKRIKE